jgi:predicted Zn-dependent protease
MTFFEGDSPCGVSIYVVFDRLMGETMKKVIIMHEIGHAMNLDHLSSERAIMSEYYTPSVLFLTKDDLYEFCKVWFC